MKPIRYFLYFVLATSLFFWGCEKVGDWFIGVPLQPDFTDKQFEPGLNIFGVIRIDESVNENGSFVYVQQVLPAVGDTASEWEVLGADVLVKKIPDPAGEEILFRLSSPDSSSMKAYYRPEGTFRPQSGESYALRCEATGLPLLEGTTTLPGKAAIVPGSMQLQTHTLSFQILSDTSTYLLDVYLTAGNVNKNLRIVPEENGITPISFTSGTDISEGIISIYSYDKNLATYNLTSNVSVNFNKFKRPFSTVNGGYGVFGSVNVARISYPL